jgi:anthranilate synthase component 2
MILIIDNYDSFTFNLYQMIGGINPDILVIKNDEMTLDEIKKLEISHIIISPGPGKPKDAILVKEVIEEFKNQVPILGVCLGHQAICEHFGGQVSYAKVLMHGKSANIHIANGSPIFRGLSPIITGARYHSLSAKRETLPDELLVIAEDDTGEVMGIKHAKYNIYGVQFHPESILTNNGKRIIENFLKLGGKKND